MSETWDYKTMSLTWTVLIVHKKPVYSVQSEVGAAQLRVHFGADVGDGARVAAPRRFAADALGGDPVHHVTQLLDFNWNNKKLPENSQYARIVYKLIRIIDLILFFLNVYISLNIIIQY